MKMLIERQEGLLVSQMGHFGQEIPNYEVILDLNSGKVIILKKAISFISFLYPWQTTIQSIAHSFTSYKNQALYGPSELLLGALPLLPVYPAVIPEIPLGNAKNLFSDMIQDCMKSPNFTKDIGLALGIIEPDVVAKPEEVTPVLTVKLTTGGHPLLHTVKGIYSGYEVWKDSMDTKGYIKLDTSIYPDYIDNSPLPVIGVAKTWKYKIIYSLKGEVCGNWSNEVIVGVYGQI